MTQRVLVVAAHPDDEILGCGATAARHAAEGDEVWLLILGEGITSRPGLSAAQTQDELSRLRSCAETAAAVIGAKRLILRRFPDNKFDTVARLDIIQAVEAIVAELKPQVVYTHFAEDLNIDHQIVSEAVRTALRPLPGSSVRRVLSFEVPSATEWRFNAAGFCPNVYRDAAGFLDAKLKALEAYAGEMRPFPHPRSRESIRALARLRGTEAGLAQAEAFRLIREIRP